MSAIWRTERMGIPAVRPATRRTGRLSPVRIRILYTFPIILLLLVFALAACGPAGPVESTASVSTVEPEISTQPPPDFTPPATNIPPTITPIPTLPGGLGPTELKYSVLARYPDFFFCDPDYYPVARSDELVVALEKFPELEANSEEFETILKHNDLEGLTGFSDDQKLLIYREHKKLAALPFDQTGETYTFQLLSAKSEGDGELITGKIDSQGTLTGEQRSPAIATCPICLAAGTQIDTPAGPIAVEDVRPGTLVWTLDSNGTRIARPVLRVNRTIVPLSHRVVHLVLEDGRELLVSPGHPTVNGHTAGQLQPGEILDGSIIRSVDLVGYAQAATYDLLPAGDTGYYWANGILIASTLSRFTGSLRP